MIRTLVAVTFVIACYFIFYLIAMARTKQRRKMDERVRTLFAQREPIYKRSGTVILTDSRPLADIAAHVIRAWRRDAVDFVRARGGR